MIYYKRNNKFIYNMDKSSAELTGIITLPAVLIGLLTTYLDWNDYYNLSLTCKKVRNDLNQGFYSPPRQICLKHNNLPPLKSYHSLQLTLYNFPRRKLKYLKDKNIRRLQLSNQKISVKYIQRLVEYCPNIEDLNISHIRISDGDLNDVIGLFTKVKNLNLAYTNFTNKGLTAVLNKCKNLECLNLESTNITDVGLKDIQDEYPYLTRFNLTRLRITDETVKHLFQKCKNLEEINLENTDITDDLLMFMSKHVSNLKKIWLAWTKITDGGVEILTKGCNKLEFITLARRNVQGTCIQSIYDNCKNIKHIQYNYTRCNIPELIEKYPNVHYEYYL